MFVAVTLLSLISHMPYGASVIRPCVPNTQFQVKDRICNCNSFGRWSEVDCKITRRTNCQPGQIVWQDCNRCICQENGQLQCTLRTCEDKTAVNFTNNLDLDNLWCLPFVSYYVNCSLCVCPASGKMTEARCAKDVSCPFEVSSDFLQTVKKNACIPKVMYLFPCLQCHCSSEGFFSINKCVETCHKPHVLDSIRRCIPKTFYRKGCNICQCPENSIANEEMCTKSDCHKEELYHLASLTNKSWDCYQNTFTEPKCFYCECNQEGTVNENACLHSECLNIDDHKYSFEHDRCIPGEMVPICTQCLCLRNGFTDPRYCTKVCSHTQKLKILEMALKESRTNHRIIDTSVIQKADSYEVCEPNSIYLDDGKYCLCPDIGSTNFQLCISITEKTNSKVIKDNSNVGRSSIVIDFTVACEPSSFVEFDCNTCYCLKTGKLDPKWCTYDDCEAKKRIQDHRKNPDLGEFNGVCTPGALIKNNCNFCICPENGKLKDKACTKNSCSELQESSTEKKFSCEPLVYYNVDCNICSCPKNGLKNVAKCTKNICDKSFLRTEACLPGNLFSENCNVCVCAPNGNKLDSVCTNSSCSDASIPWTKIFKISQSILSSPLEDATRSLELCFPGEEFVQGCKVCVCPDMGLKVYATCTHSLCENGRHQEGKEHFTGNLVAMWRDATSSNSRMRRHGDVQTCVSFNVTDCEKKECTPGSLYIIRCRQCICPYMGSIHHFCRPLPKGTYCEQAYPGLNYLPMGRRSNKDNYLQTNIASTNLKETVHIHACDKPGRMMDECFICECDMNAIIEEHCFKSNAEGCVDRTPSFFVKNKDTL